MNAIEISLSIYILGKNLTILFRDWYQAHQQSPAIEKIAGN